MKLGLSSQPWSLWSCSGTLCLKGLSNRSLCAIEPLWFNSFCRTIVSHFISLMSFHKTLAGQSSYYVLKPRDWVFVKKLDKGPISGLKATVTRLCDGKTLPCTGLLPLIDLYSVFYSYSPILYSLVHYCGHARSKVLPYPTPQ